MAFRLSSVSDPVEERGRMNERAGDASATPCCQGRRNAPSSMRASNRLKPCRRRARRRARRVQGPQEITTVDKPKEILERGLLAPSMNAHLLGEHDAQPAGPPGMLRCCRRRPSRGAAPRRFESHFIPSSGDRWVNGAHGSAGSLHKVQAFTLRLAVAELTPI